MVIIYYRNKDGEITRYHSVSEYVTMEKLKAFVDDLNRDEIKDGTTAYIEEVDDNSLTAQLFRESIKMREYDEEELRYMIDFLESILYDIRRSKEMY